MRAERALKRLGLLLVLLLGTAADPAAPPEPAGFWTGPMHGAVPATITGGQVVHTVELEALLRHSDAVLIDVTPAPRKPAGLAPNAVWMPAQHRNIASSVWLSDLGAGVLTAGQDTWFRARLKELSRGKRDTPLVLYCHPQCWASWNAAKRAISYGYRKVYWYPDGIEGWEKAGLPTASAVAILPPS